MTDRLAEIRARLDAATSDNRGIEFEHRGHDDIIGRYALVREPSLTFAAHAPADIAWLLAEVERMRTENGTELLPGECVAHDVTKQERRR